jgi:pyruvate/oxaloacetate carboxyltransferase
MADPVSTLKTKTNSGLFHRPPVGIIDTTLRDAQQCLWATRMTTPMMLPIADRMDGAGFDMIDFMAPVTFDVCVRYLRENPWEWAPTDAAEVHQHAVARLYAQQEPGWVQPRV